MFIKDELYRFSNPATTYIIRCTKTTDNNYIHGIVIETDGYFKLGYMSNHFIGNEFTHYTFSEKTKEDCM